MPWWEAFFGPHMIIAYLSCMLLGMSHNLFTRYREPADFVTFFGAILGWMIAFGLIAAGVTWWTA